MSEWLSDVHSSTNEVGSYPLRADVNLANPAFPAKINSTHKPLNASLQNQLRHNFIRLSVYETKFTHIFLTRNF